MKKLKNSIILKIAFAYIALALINIIFFSVMILENQTDLIIESFKHQSESLAKSTSTQFKDLNLDAKNISNEDIETIKDLLKIYDINWFALYNGEGKLIKTSTKKSDFSKNDTNNKTIDESSKNLNKDNTEVDKINLESNFSKKINEKIQQLESTNSLFQTRYLIELHKENFSIELLISLINENNLKNIKSNNLYLLTSLNLKSIQERLNLLYFQVLGAVVWGIIFHTLFGIFLIRVIFRRINILVTASEQIEAGDLSTRIQWKIDLDNLDELDVLGVSFNSMVSSVQDKVRTISKQVTVIEGLNNQIQKELRIGKDVQKMLINVENDLLKVYNPQIFSRPLREVSGDMIHYFQLNDGSKGIFFADASGHGVPAALVTAISYLTFEDILKRNVARDEILNQLNSSLTERLKQSFYLTAVAMVFDSDGVWITNAGHNTFYIFSQENNRIDVESKGLPIGILPESAYKMEKYKLNKGDKIFIYSDGLTETLDDAGNEYGNERIIEIIEKNKHLNSIEIAKALEIDYNVFAAHYKDDVSYLLLEIN